LLGKTMSAALRPAADAPPAPAPAPDAAPGGGLAGAVPATPAALTPAPTGDEFGSFLTEISSAVARQVEAWRGRVAEAILRWQGEGYRTARLERLLDADAPVDPDAILRDYEDDVEQLRLLEAEAQDLDAQVAGTPLFRDPDRIEEVKTEVARVREGLSPPPGPAPIWQLSGFAESAGNRMALHAARAILVQPGSQYNPLVIIGGSGVGKTHLLHGIGNVLAGQTGAIVACLRAPDFVDELIKAIDQDRVTRWRARYRRVTALLLDDVHLLGGKERTQEELFWLYNQLAESGRQMIFTSSVPPRELADVEPRLRTRLEAGLVVELPAPDREVRQAIVDRMLLEKLGAPDPELSAYLAGRPVETVRALQGLVQRVIAAAEAMDQRPTVGLGRELLEGNPAAPARRTSQNRTSGLLSPTGGLRSREKVVWDWPDVADRLIEDFR
ncbi:MAG: DnaA/Hda family protein, partial [Gemmatimonadota bacterium]|nr:DnaA/Hda family protein [Gemmatimonadota bacterium]